jgi:hypothetical protein
MPRSAALPLGMPAIARREGANLQITGLKHGKSTIYKLPAGASVTDEFGRTVDACEIACERVFVRCDVKLAGFEEKVLKIIKGEGGLSRAERKQAFLGSLENVKVSPLAPPETQTREQNKWSSDSRVNIGNARGTRTSSLGSRWQKRGQSDSRGHDNRLFGLFDKEITDGADERLVAALKAAIKNFERDVFFALLAARDQITADVYALLVERVIGIKLLRGKIQLMPRIAITGSFELSFTYRGAPYSFKVTERGSGFTVNYGDTEYKNFMQVAVE